jgi:hypothetical protein
VLKVFVDSRPVLAFFVRWDGEYIRYGPVDREWQVMLGPGFMDYVWQLERERHERKGRAEQGATAGTGTPTQVDPTTDGISDTESCPP